MLKYNLSMFTMDLSKYTKEIKNIMQNSIYNTSQYLLLNWNFRAEVKILS